MENKVVATLSIPVDDELHLQTEAGQVVVSSRYVAERFGKRHGHVIEAIENKINNLTTENSVVNLSSLFIPSTYIHNGNTYKEYLLTRKGFSFIVMGFTGAEADKWKLAYIEAFDSMETYIREQKPLLDYNAELLEFDRTAKVIGLNKNDKLMSVLSMMKRHNVPTLGLEELVAYKMPKEVTRQECDKEALEYVVKHDPRGSTLRDYYKKYSIYCFKNGIKSLEKVPFCKVVRQLGYEAKSRRVNGEPCKVWL